MSPCSALDSARICWKRLRWWGGARSLGSCLQLNSTRPRDNWSLLKEAETPHSLVSLSLSPVAALSPISEGRSFLPSFLPIDMGRDWEGDIPASAGGWGGGCWLRSSSAFFIFCARLISVVDLVWEDDPDRGCTHWETPGGPSAGGGGGGDRGLG